MNTVLKISNISFGYNKDELIYDNFSLNLKKGQLASILGASSRDKL